MLTKTKHKREKDVQFVAHSKQEKEFHYFRKRQMICFGRTEQNNDVKSYRSLFPPWFLRTVSIYKNKKPQLPLEIEGIMGKESQYFVL